MEDQIVAFYLSLGDDDDDDAEMKTCEKFGIDSRTLDFILEADLIDTMMNDGLTDQPMSSEEKLLRTIFGDEANDDA